MQHVAIINSRQALRPTGRDEWIQATLRAVHTLRTESNYRFLASLGETTYELTLYEICRMKSHAEIVLTTGQLQALANSKETLRNILADEFNLSSERMSFRCLETRQESSKQAQHLRDAEILRRADIVVPVSIRPGGFWDTQLADSASLAGRIDNRFRVPYQKSHTRIKQSFVERRPLAATARRLENYLIHWTRTANGPWPGERRSEYYRAICDSEQAYPRSSLATLERILAEKRIRGSSRHMPQGAAMVSLTSASLAESIALMKYRARYREMTIEPYAIALPSGLAKQSGIRQVTYLAEQELSQLSDTERLFAHAVGAEKTDWKREKEWRADGDLDLSPVWSDLIVLTESDEQARRITKDYRLDAYATFAPVGQ